MDGFGSIHVHRIVSTSDESEHERLRDREARAAAAAATKMNYFAYGK